MGFSDIIKQAGELAADVGSLISAGLNNAFLGSENTNRALSETAKKIADAVEIGAQRNYILSGFSNYEKTRPNTRSVISQTPEVIILVKKKMFSSLSENYSSYKMDEAENHFLKAAKKLFENKCNEISAYEQLTKIDRIIRQTGIINSPIAKMIYSTINKMDCQFSGEGIIPASFAPLNYESFETDIFGGEESSGINKYLGYLKKHGNEIKRLKQVLSLNGFSPTTNWVRDSNFEREGEVGVGTGVIELTLVKSFNCTTSINFGQGSASLTIEDPYHLMLITEDDIERAIYQSSDTGFSLIDTLTSELEDEIQEAKQELNKSRLERGASTVTFHTNIRTRIYNILTVILDRIGLEITAADGSGIDYNKLDDPRVPEIEKFTTNERHLANRIYDDTFKLLKNRIRNFENFKAYNYGSNTVRRMMRLNFLGKQIIQPMDTITAFIDSKRVDDQLLAFDVKTGFSESAGSIFGGFTKNITSLFGGNNVLGLADQTFENEAEKNSIAGADFPQWLWDELRPNFVSENFGTCVFSGLVEKASESFGGGKYTVNVSCKDNTNYFEQSAINTKPGLDQFNGHLYDPLTPFDFEFDAATGLLPELSEFKLLEGNNALVNDKLLRFQDGKNAGQIMTMDKFLDPDFEPITALSKLTQTNSNFVRRVFDAPDSFTYQWKRGIGSAMYSQSGTNDGLISSVFSDRVANVIIENPFGGQDVINVVSILICGMPYDFNNFMRSATEFGTINIDSAFNPDTDFFSGIFRQIKKQNKIWGGFVPFKSLNVDPDTFGAAMALQLMSFSHSNTIVKKRNERTKLLDKLMKYEGDSFQFDISTYNFPGDEKPVEIGTRNRAVTYPIIKRIVELDAEIKLHEEAIKTSMTNSQVSKNLIVIGNNVLTNDLSGSTKKDQQEQYRLKIAEQNQYTKRRLWEVKANRDKNLFIVGTEYDLDYDLQTIAKNISSNFDYMNTNWTSVSQQMKQAVEYIGMELFANSQGHIELRVPKYNRIPSSVLYKMLKKREEYGIQVYPNFLEQTFKNRLETTFTEIEIIEDQIRLHAIALGAKGDDNSIATLLKGSLNTDVTKNSFVFATEENGTMTGIRKAVGLVQNDQIPTEESKPFELADLSPISIEPEEENIEENQYVKRLSYATNTFNNFDIVKQNTVLSDLYKVHANSENFFNDQQTAANGIRERLSKKLSVSTDSSMIKTIQQLLPNSKNEKLSPIDVINLQNKLSGLLIQRHEALLSAVNLVKNIDASSRFNSVDSDIYAKLVMPNLFGDKDIPGFLRDMVEIESIDDYGPNSGKRFVIKESEIISMEYSETSPDYIGVEISGAEQGGLVGGQGFQIDSGIKLANVWSIDYDLWRMYGFKLSPGTIYLPFMNNPELQLAPYALFLLNQQRAKIFRGSVQMVGKESIQPGEVYYIEERGMLFYSESVSHSFDYGGSYTTTINLNYGRVPGEYIPTPLDVIGKNLYKGNYYNVGNFRVSRTGTTGNDKSTSLGVVAFPNYALTGPSSKSGLSVLQQLTDTSVGENNLQIIEGVIAKASSIIDTTFPQENRGYEAITVRVYYFGDPDPNLAAAANLVIERLVNRGIPKSKIVGRYPGETRLLPGIPFFIKLDAGGSRNPSSAAISIAKKNEFLGNIDNVDEVGGGALYSSNSGSSKQMLFALLYKVIDIWIESDITPSEEIINSAIKSPNVANGSVASPGTTPGDTHKKTEYENMREFYRKVNNDFESFVTVFEGE